MMLPDTYFNIVSTGDKYSQKLTLTLTIALKPLTLYDPGIPGHTLLTLREPRNKLPMQQYTPPDAAAQAVAASDE